MLFRSPRHRTFEYRPHFLKPERSEKFKFSDRSRRHRYAVKSLWYYFILALAFTLIYLYIRGGLWTKPRVEEIELSPLDAAPAILSPGDSR